MAASERAGMKGNRREKAGGAADGAETVTISATITKEQEAGLAIHEAETGQGASDFIRELLDANLRACRRMAARRTHMNDSKVKIELDPQDYLDLLNDLAILTAALDWKPEGEKLGGVSPERIWELRDKLQAQMPASDAVRLSYEEARRAGGS